MEGASRSRPVDPADELAMVLGGSLGLAALDHAVKGGSRLSGELELERAIVAITHTPSGVAA